MLPPFEATECVAELNFTVHASAHVYKVTNHQFNWWFEISPQKGYVTARPRGRYRKHLYWSAIKRYFLNLLF